MHTSKTCLSCKSSQLKVLIDFGEQVVSNKYKRSIDEVDKTFPLVLSQCQECALIQLTSMPGLQNIKVNFPWLSYKEAEDHLDDLSNEMAKILIKSSDNHKNNSTSSLKKILGLSFKDITLIERMKNKNFDAKLLDMEEDLDLGKNNIELISQSLPNKLSNITKKYGLLDCIVARHIIEHSYDMCSIISDFKKMIKPDGYLVLEVPDFEKSLKNLDYPAVWEEHTAYFTENTFKEFLNKNDFEIVFFKNYDYMMENALVAVVKQGKASTHEDVNLITKEIELGNYFGQSFIEIKSKIKSLLNYKNKNSVCVMGAGHLGCAFVNYFEIEDKIAAIVDDDINKKGLYLPGTKLAITDSSILNLAEIKTCLLSINPRNLVGFFTKFESFIKSGGEFYSIFKNSTVPLPVFLDEKDLGLIKKSEEAYYVEKTNGISIISNIHIDFLKSNLYKSKTGRSRICGHKGPEDSIHEMIILFAGGNKVLPHKHISKSESFHMMEGNLDIVIFNDDGSISRVINLSANRNYYYRIDSALYHSVIIRGDWALIHETTNGPFDANSSTFAPWAPANATPEFEKFFTELDDKIKKMQHPGDKK